MKFQMERQLREGTYCRLVALQHEHQELMENITGPKITTMKLMMTGSIDGKECEIRGLISRRGGGEGKSNNGPCKNCVKMLDCKTTEKMQLVGVNCPYIGNPGHIVQLPQEVQEVVGSKEWLEKLNLLMLVKYPCKRREKKMQQDQQLISLV